MNSINIPVAVQQGRAASIKYVVAAVVAVPVEVAAIIGNYTASMECNSAERLLAMHRDLSTILPYYIHMVVGRWNGRAMRVESVPALIKHDREYVIWFAKEECRMWQDICNNLLWGKSAELKAYENLIIPAMEEVTKIVVPLPSYIPRPSLINYNQWLNKQVKN